MRPIKEGDTVDVLYGTLTSISDVIVRHVPCDVGDLWYFEDSTGEIIAQNPVSANLDMIIKRARSNK